MGSLGENEGFEEAAEKRKNDVAVLKILLGRIFIVFFFCIFLLVAALKVLLVSWTPCFATVVCYSFFLPSNGHIFVPVGTALHL